MILFPKPGNLQVNHYKTVLLIDNLPFYILQIKHIYTSPPVGFYVQYFYLLVELFWLMEKNELDKITKFLRKLHKRAKDEGLSINIVRFLEIVLCRLYNSKLDSCKIKKTLYGAKNTLLSEMTLSVEEKEYIERFDEM